MNPAKVFLYAEFQASIPFEDIDWEPVNVQMKEFTGLKSKTWLSGLGNNSLGGFYEFDSVDNAQNYIDNLLIPFTREIKANLTVKLFNGDVVADASKGMDSPYY